MVVAAGTLIAGTGLVAPPTGRTAPGSPVIALVNEDEAATFNDSSYTFGRDFVSLVANDDHYDWQVVSRGVAEKAYADKAVSAVIVLPRSFTRDILTLQDLNPTAAVVDYKLVPGDSLSQQRLHNEVSTILKDINTRVVEMYFASVAGNISGAQANMDSVVAGQSRLLDAVSSGFRPSVEKVASGQQTSIGLSEILTTMNAAWIAAQNSFTMSTTDTLTRTGASLAQQQPALTDYFALQEAIARINIANGNGAIAQQSSSDKEFYDAAFGNHIDGLLRGDGAWGGLAGLSSTDSSGTAAGILPTLQEAVAGYDRLAVDYNSRVADLSASLAGQRSQLETSLGQLEALETQLLREYFDVAMPADNGSLGLPAGDTGITDDSYDMDFSRLTSDMARAGLAEKLAGTFADQGSAAQTVQKYQQQIDARAQNIPTDPSQYTPLFDAMKAADPTFDSAPYLDHLQVIQAYDAARGLSAPSLSVLQPNTDATEATTTTLPVTVAPGQRVMVSADIPGNLPSTSVEVGVSSPPSCPATVPDCVQLDQNAKTATIDNTAGTQPLMADVSYTVTLRAFDGSATVGYSQQTIAPASSALPSSLGSVTYVVAPASNAATAIAGDLASITTTLGDIQTTAGLLQFLFGSPDDSAASFHDAVVATGDFDHHSDDSFFNRYGVVGAATIADALSDSDVAAYLALGRDNISAIVTQIAAVRAQMSSIDEDAAALSEMHLSNTYFSSVLGQLEDWYAAAMTSINAAPGRWNAASNDVIQLTTVPWNDQDAGKAELYLDDKTGPALYRTLTQLIDSTSTSAQSVAASAQLISDNTDQFNTLLAGVKDTQTQTQAVLGAMQGTIDASTADATAGSEFSKRFSTVLSNTRATGVDPTKIYEHFANPVTAEDRTPAASPATGTAFDYRWILLLAAGALIGAVITRLIGRGNRTGRKDTA